jgi:hypothetical protein
MITALVLLALAAAVAVLVRRRLLARRRRDVLTVGPAGAVPGRSPADGGDAEAPGIDGLAFKRTGLGGDRADAAADYVATFMVTMYTVLLAFIVVVLWQRVDDLNTDLRAEGHDLTQLVWTGQRLDAADREALRSAVSAYTAAVLEREWPPADQAATASTAAAIAALRARLSVPFSLDDQTTLRDQELAAVDDLDAARADRVAKTLKPGPEILVVGLVLLSAATVLIPFLLGPRAEPLSVIGLAVTVAVVAAALAFVLNLRAPYGGYIDISRTPMQNVQTQLAVTR